MDKPPLDEGKNFVAFGEDIHRSIGRFREWVKASRRSGRRIAGYGAAGRGILTLAAVADPGDFVYVCDKNPSLQGYYTPKSHVPIVGLGRVFEKPRVDEIVVFSFGYFKEIATDLAEYTAKGGKLTSMLEKLSIPERCLRINLWFPGGPRRPDHEPRSGVVRPQVGRWRNLSNGSVCCRRTRQVFCGVSTASNK